MSIFEHKIGNNQIQQRLSSSLRSRVDDFEKSSGKKRFSNLMWKLVLTLKM